MSRRLTTDEYAALTAYAIKHGEGWKTRLNQDWIDEAAGPHLQPLFTSHGLSWLDGYSLADWPLSMFEYPADPLDAQPDPAKAARACRKFIRAYLHGFEHVDWEEIQQALNDALDAFGLDPEYIEVKGRA